MEKKKDMQGQLEEGLKEEKKNTGMMDMGKKNEPMKNTAIEAKPGPSVSYPSINLYDKVPAELMKRELGEEVEIRCIVKIKSKSIRENDGNDKREEMSMDILKMGIDE